MKRIPLRRMPDPDGSILESIEVLRQIIRKPLDMQRGADIDEVRKGIRLLDRLEQCDSNVLEIEDADWEHLVAKTRAMQWAIIDRRLLTIVDDVLDASEQLTLNDQLELANSRN
jgi:hypothetical protein